MEIWLVVQTINILGEDPSVSVHPCGNLEVAEKVFNYYKSKGNTDWEITEDSNREFKMETSLGDFLEIKLYEDEIRDYY